MPGFTDWLMAQGPLQQAAQQGAAPQPGGQPASTDPGMQDYVQQAIAEQMRQQTAARQNDQARAMAQAGRFVGAPFPTPAQAGFAPGPARYPLLNAPGPTR